VRTTHTAVAAALIVVVAIAGSTPAHATGTGTDELEAALELVELTEQVAAEHTQDGALDANDQRESELTVDVDENTAELELFDATVTVALPVEVVAHVGELPTGDSVIVTEDDAAFAALEKEDGSVQVVYSISGSDSPTRFPFEIATDADGQWHTMDNGSVLLLDGEGSIIVGAAAPWAVDAAGVSVPTRFELADGVLTQVVDHRTRTFPTRSSRTRTSAGTCSPRSHATRTTETCGSTPPSRSGGSPSTCRHRRGGRSSSRPGGTR